MKKVDDLLTKLGLSETEQCVYLHLLEKGPGVITTLADRCHMFRPVIYRAVARLMARGLVYVIPQGKRKLYAPHKPEVLRELVRDLSIDLEEALPDMETLVQTATKPARIEIFEGKKGVAHVFMDVVQTLKQGETFYRYTSEQDVAKVNSYLPRGYRALRDKKHLERLVISNKVSGVHKKTRLERFMKFVPQDVDQFQENIIQLVYGPKVALIDLTNLQTIIIENKALAEFQKTIFTLLYKRLT
ncbi:MAG: hypothetical protein A2542_01475 [Parcubacteria group bacterium RIFOXYD2_FULL_52_8]|nr:MAG: hypothetical protein A2542_01475 [Parcubacteria group bacterium RIFOXYD2_FULL_52_8]